MTYSTEKYCTN